MKTKIRRIDNYITFYHEYLIPDNYYFREENNINKKYKLLLISSPSRMGNHILHSMIDGNEEIPRVPGEDGMLFHCFKYANISIHEFLHRLKSKDAINQLEEYASTGGKHKKWKSFKHCFDNNIIPKIYAGIQFPTDSPYITDYQGLIFDINYESYHNYLIKNINTIRKSKCLKDLLVTYCEALKMLDFETKKNTYYDAQLVCSGMRIMCMWTLKCFSESRLLCSIRPFETYAISHIRSRYKNEDFSNEKIREAWEHWFHKVIDFMVLKMKFPDRVTLVNFEDIINKTENISKKICYNLEVPFNNNMIIPTAFGNKTKGNSSLKNNDSNIGKFYKRNLALPKKLIPKDYHFIWEEISKMFI